jgi:arginine repressor
VLKVYEACQVLEEAGMEITAKSVTEKSQYSQSTVRHYLNELVRARLLLRDESAKEYRYQVLKEKDVALSDVGTLESSFPPEEFENWLSSIMPQNSHRISYEEIKRYIYSPISPMVCSNMDRQTKESYFEPEKAGEMATMKDAVKGTFSAKDTFTKEELVKELENHGIKDAEKLIEHLKFKGVLSEPYPGQLKVVTHG